MWRHARERDSRISDDGSHHVSTVVDRRGAADMPKDILGLGTAGQDDATTGSHDKRTRRLENPNRIDVTTGVESEIHQGYRKRTARGLIDAGSEREHTEFAGAGIKTSWP